MNTDNQGVLYVIATPIGNLQDISARALTMLRQVKIIAAEDTRHTRQLLQHFNIDTPLLSLHQHNEIERTPTLIKRLQQGESIALVSDAGTPLIQDPGYHLITQCWTHAIKISPIPGACALISALSIAGLPGQAFMFAGFLPAKQGARIKRLTELKNATSTLVFYEAPHRMCKVMDDIHTVLGETRLMVIARELTKTFESIERGTIQQLHAWVNTKSCVLKGEFVILIEGYQEVNLIKSDEISDAAKRILSILTAQLPLKQAVNLCAQITQIKKNKIYQYALNHINFNTD